jgi:hypothetical protein
VQQFQECQDFCFLGGRIVVPFCSAVVLNAGIALSMDFIYPFCCNGVSVRCIYNKDMFFAVC